MINKIKTEQINARKNKDKVLSDILTVLYSEIAMVGKNKGNTLTSDDDAVKVINKFAKNVKDTIKVVKDTDKIKDLEYELAVYESYLPKLMSKNELTGIIEDIISHDSNINIGTAMKFLSTNYNGQYDGKIASDIIRSLI